jgi:heme-degrading monooxygenase HmoA
MFIVIFEVVAKQLKPKLEAIDGFIDNERFKSKQDERRVLSLSTWRDEKAVIRWRTHEEHHGVQEKGRFEVFEDYHLRVGEITADAKPPKGQAVLQNRLDETEVGEAKAVTLTELSPAEGTASGAPAERFAQQLGLDPQTSGLVSEKCRGSAGLASERTGGRRSSPAPPRPGDPGLWNVRASRSAAVLSGRQTPREAGRRGATTRLVTRARASAWPLYESGRAGDPPARVPRATPADASPA